MADQLWAAQFAARVLVVELEVELSTVVLVESTMEPQRSLGYWRDFVDFVHIVLDHPQRNNHIKA